MITGALSGSEVRLRSCWQAVIPTPSGVVNDGRGGDRLATAISAALLHQPEGSNRSDETPFCRVCPRDRHYGRLLHFCSALAAAEPDPVRHPGADRRPTSRPSGRCSATTRRNVADAPRGGDLWIRYPDGSLKNLTAIGRVRKRQGFTGTERHRRARAVGALGRRQGRLQHGDRGAAQQFMYEPYYWQLYEVTGLGQNDNARDHQGAEPAGGLQQRQPDLRHRRPHHLHVRSAAQRRAPSLPAARRVRRRRRR